MDWGLTYPAHIHSWEWVSYGEPKGFSAYMPYDTQCIGSDVYQTLALCALHTERMKLGTGITNPRSRIAPVTADSFATLNELAPGRVVVGISSGNTARRTLGMPASRLAEIREHVEILRAMFKGEEAPYTEGPDRYMDRARNRYAKFLNPTGGFVNIADPIPIWVAGSGPKALELAGEIGDGVILFGAIGESFVNYAMDHIRVGAERAGKNPDDLYKLVMTAFHITKPGQLLEDPEVKRAVGPFVASSLNLTALALVNAETKAIATAKGTPLPADVREGIMSFADAYYVGELGIERRHLQLYSEYLLGWKEEHAPLVTPEMIKTSTLTGSAEEILETCHRLEEQGINQVMIQPILDPKETIDRFHENIMSRY
ncbi:MAG TPA: LLM class flavin-dependent oxidoreductase [Actinomycetes bacterium]|jgi:alkanesulfonate monooxygenase SsuD/methylene tetrahydromethanopterin reductase-like flavin-dependent oxidoreductase (luciferase family)|nr:LLM class flavin-dependent oxidoreductase [Actinomycetes bacterium]